MLSEEQAKQIKEQILNQIESWDADEEQKQQAREQIEAMNEEQLEEFLKKQQQTQGQGQAKEQKQECVFCSILQGKIPSYKIDENKKAIAILEINPLSKGHSMIISKTHNKLENPAFVLANKIAKQLKRKFKAIDVKIENANLFGHNLVQVIPLYKDAKLEKKKADEKELILLQDKLRLKKRIKKVKQKPIQEIKLEPAPRRIP